MKKAKPQAEKPEEFKRFEDFTRRLMAVPKKEIDEQKAKYEKQKTARKKKAAWILSTTSALIGWAKQKQALAQWVHSTLHDYRSNLTHPRKTLTARIELK